jgi:uncharacterized protein YoxC
MLKLDNETILLAIVVVTGLAFLLQAIILLAIFITMRRAIKSLREETEELRSSVTPCLYDARELLANTQAILNSAQEFFTNAQGFFTRIAPKVEVATADAVEITHKLRVQTEEIHASATELIERVRRQSDRLDDMLTRLLDTADRAGGFVVQVVSKPVQQVSHVLGAVKAVVESLRSSRGHHRPVPPSAGGSRFV